MNIEYNEIKYYQPRFKRWINSKYWDSISENLSDIHIDIITRVMNAEKDSDCSYIIWKQCDYVLDKIRMIKERIKF